MKKLLILFLLTSFCLAADMLDADYNFIEHAFENTKPVSEQQFQKAINSKTLEPVPDTLGGKIRTFLFGRKYQTNNPVVQKEEKQDPVSEAQIIQEMKNGIYFIKLLAPIISVDNKIIQQGNYKIKEEDNMLVFYQGYKEYGRLKLYKYQDDKKHEHDLTYSRVDIVSDDTIRIVYATISDTKCALDRVYK